MERDILYDCKRLIPDAEVYGLDISEYAIANSKEEIKDRLQVGSATKLPWNDCEFDLVINKYSTQFIYMILKRHLKKLKELEKRISISALKATGMKKRK